MKARQGPRRWVTMGVVATVAVGLGVFAAVRFNGGNARERAAASPDEHGAAHAGDLDAPARPDFERWYAALSGEEREIVDDPSNREAPRYRELLIASFYLRERLSGDPGELRLFADALRAYSPPAPSSGEPAPWREVDTAIQSLGFLAHAWSRLGRVEQWESVCTDEAVRCLDDPDEVVRWVAGGLLYMIRVCRPDGVLPPAAEARFNKAMENEAFRFQVMRHIDALRESAGEAGREFPE